MLLCMRPSPTAPHVRVPHTLLRWFPQIFHVRAPPSHANPRRMQYLEPRALLQPRASAEHLTQCTRQEDLAVRPDQAAVD
mmetsp:Transcript_12383/g.19071  ORF Transcript_12383/g.19071 Transcript_12383/m.19071 type:complete len:80 (+) Transcript_12383:441-680(+)